MEHGTRTRLTTAAVLLLVLSSGVVLGVALDRQLESREVSGREMGGPEARPGTDPRSRGFNPRSGEPFRDPPQGRESSRRGSSMIVEQVGLTEAQKEQVDSIVGYFRSQMRSLHEEFDSVYSSRVRELNRRAREEVQAVLTEEQLVTYDSLRAEWARRREERRPDSLQTGESRGSRGAGHWNRP